jgi:tetratricopeptide (TPR) repeat protein
VGYYYNYKKIRTYFLSLFLFILAVLSREGALLLPLFIILCGAILNVDKKRLLLSLLPFLLICGFYLFFRTRFMPSDKLKLQEILSWQKWSAFFYLAQNYISQLILPTGLAIKILPKGYLLNLILIPLSLVYLLVTTILIIARHKVVMFGFVFYLLGLLPVLNLFSHICSLGKILSEPYVYMASVGFFIILAYILIRLFAHFPKIISAAIILIIFSYGSFTVINNINYKDEKQFYNYMLKVDPGNTIAHLNLGNIYLKKKMFDEAAKEARVVLRLEPDAWDAYLLLGNVSKEKGDLNKAEELYNRVLILKPGSFEAMNNLGLIYKMQGTDEKAIEEFKRAIAINPELVTTMHNLADILIGKKLYNEALALCDKILKLKPQDINAHVKIGIILAESGHLQQAELVFKEALRLDPDSVEALRNLGVLYANSGDFNRAVSLWKRVLAIKPDDEEAKKNIERAKTIKENQRH